RMCLAFGIVGVALSFGPIVPGYPSLYAAVPLFQAIRASARFGYLGLFAVAVLAGFGLATLRRMAGQRGALRRVLSAAALVLIFIESYAAPIGYQPFTTIPEIYRMPLSAHDAIVVDLSYLATDAIYRYAPYMLVSMLNF